ncbi:MAG: TonB-dependent receptor [Thauera sp.]|jgi:iron complex outermembrane receptor protein|nr:TonB-dependent receptor [Thauera sp.]
MNPSKRQLALAISVMGISAGSFTSLPASAQVRGLEEVIVTARKTEENIQDIPVAITSLSAADMARQGVLNVKDINLTTPSMNITQAAGNPVSPRVSLRGQVQNDTVFTLDPSVGIYLDEIYVGRAPGAMLDFYDIERVEVLKGPQGTLYGRNTTGGAMKIITNKADASSPLGGYLKGGAGNFNGKLMEGAINVPLIDDKLGLRVAGLVNKRDGYADNVIADPVTGAPLRTIDTGDKNTQSARFDLVLNATDDLTFELQGDYSDLDTNGLVGYNKRGDIPGVPQSTLTTGSPASLLGHMGYVRSSSDELKATTNLPTDASNLAWGVSLTSTYNISEELTAKLVYGHREMDGNYDFDVDGTSLGIINTFQEQGAEQDTVEFQLAGDHDTLEWVAGLYWYDEQGYEGSGQTLFNTAVLSGTPLLSAPYNGTGSNESQSVYGQATWRMTDTLSLTAGVRNTWDTKQFESFNRTLQANGVGTYGPYICNFTPGAPGITNDGLPNGLCKSDQEKNYKHTSWTVGIDWQVLDDVMVYLKTSNGYRAGGQNLRGTFAATLIPFDPEEVTDIEAGVKSTLWDNRLRANLAAYRSDYRDIQSTVFVNNPAGGASSTQVVNLTNAEINGAELELTAQVLDALVVNVTASYTATTFDKLSGAKAASYPAGLDAPFTPRWKYAVGGTYTQPTSVGELAFNVNYSWRDDYWANPSKLNNRTPDALTESVGLVNARITLDIDSVDMTVGLWGTNLEDKHYTQNGLVFSGGNPFYNFVNANPQEPRMFGVDVTKRF